MKTLVDALVERYKERLQGKTSNEVVILTHANVRSLELREMFEKERKRQEWAGAEKLVELAAKTMAREIITKRRG